MSWDSAWLRFRERDGGPLEEPTRVVHTVLRCTGGGNADLRAEVRRRVERDPDVGIPWGKGRAGTGL